MKRRDFLLTSTALFLSPVFLTACRKRNLNSKNFKSTKVIVIGAGAAGMYCAQLLHKAGCEVIILEAGAQIGGRIRKLEGFSDFPIELGAEEIHGERSAYYNLVKSTNTAIADGDTKDFIYLDNALQDLEVVANDADVKAAEAFLDTLEEGNYKGGDVDAEGYISANGFSTRVRPYLNARIGNEHGTSNDRISLQGVNIENELWTAGNTNALLKGGAHIDVLQKACADVWAKVQLNAVVNQINYAGGEVEVKTTANQTFTAAKVVVTVPIPLLKTNSLGFNPSLPSAKSEAIQKIGMGAGMKVILKFSQRFWDASTGSIFGTGLVPEFWSTGTGRSANNNCLTAFVHGKNAEQLVAMGNAAMLSKILSELDAMFGNAVATSSLTDHYIMNWQNETFVKGTYSYPSVGEGNAREVLAAPLDNKLYFAGEATHTKGHFASIHGAMETGLRAVKEILESLEK